MSVYSLNTLYIGRSLTFICTEETTPLIPSTSTFLLSTDAGLAPSSSSSEYKINSHANERYFDRPEVMKAIRDQLEIQTPEFVLLTDESRIGRRLRVRGEEVSSCCFFIFGRKC